MLSIARRLAAASFALLCGCASEAPPAGLVIADVTIVSPERSGPLEHAYVRILDGRIAEIDVRPLRGEEEIDGAGRFLIPGLIDSHVHLAVAPGWPAPMTRGQAEAHPDLVAAALWQDPRSYLFYGFTTVVDLAGSGERTARWNAYDLRPDALHCGAVIAIDGQLRIATTPRFSYGEGLVLDPAGYTPEGAVDRIASDGAACVKTVYDSYYPMTLEDARALVAAAHARDLPVFIHANRMDDQSFAVEAGVDVIAHGMWRNPGDEVRLDGDAISVLQAIARDRIGYQPTTQVIAGLIDMLDPEYLARPEVSDAYPADLIDWYRKEITDAYIDRVEEGGLGVEAVVEDRHRTIERAMEVTAILSNANARLLFGSDTPSDLIYTNPPGLNGRREMEHWVAAGVPLATLFGALTLGNAALIGIDDEVGSIETGKVANLLLLGANPLESVEAYDRIEVVFLHGRPMVRELLSAETGSLSLAGTFAFASGDGTELLAVDELPDPAAVTRAICGAGRAVNVQYLRTQTRRPESSGRQRAANFANEGGAVFRVEGDPVTPDETCFLAIDPDLVGRAGGARPVRENACRESEAELLAGIAARSVVNCAVLGEVLNGARLVAAQFSHEGASALAAFAIVDSGVRLYHPLPAEFREGVESVWRVDDGGVFDPGAIQLLFVAEVPTGVAAAFLWAGAEGESEVLVASDPSGRSRAIRTGYRYWSH